MKTFTATCPKDYDRHTYKLVLSNGKAISFDDYRTATYHWYQYKDHASHIEVVDSGGQGF
jgi:hypothetical protein